MPIRSILTIAALVAALLSGCGDAGPPAAEPSETATSSSAEVEPTEEPEPEPGIAELFRGFARGGDVPPMAREVLLYLGNALTGVVTPGLAADRPAWATCTEIGQYAGRSCPLSPLTVLKKHRAVEYVDKATDPCLRRYGPIPPVLRKLDRAVIVPATGSVDGCIDTFAVQLFTNDEGRLVAVSTLLGEP